jgi:general secretion pathway protein F
MLRVGEETGRISAIALKAADLYEARVERRLEQLVGIAGPIAILAVSLIVGGLIVSVMSALMSINQLAS